MATSNAPGRRTRPPTVKALPGVAAQLRRIALHEETAALLDLRATRAGSDALAAPLRRRADEQRRQARRLRAELTADTEDRRAQSG